MTKQKLKNLLRPLYKEKSEMPGLIVRGLRKPSYLIMYKLNIENDVPFTSWIDIKKFLNEEDNQVKEEDNTEASTKASE